MSDFTLIIPAHNEEKRIRGTLNSVYNTFKDDIDILVVSNGSDDNTIRVLEEWKKKHKNLNFLDFPNKLGKGGAIFEGLKITDNKYVGYVDADDAFDLKKLKEAMKYLKDYDCVMASKWKGKNFFNVTEPIFRKFLSRGWNLLVRIFLGLNFKDTQAGAKFFRGKALKEIKKKDFICKEFAFDVELLFELKKGGYKLKEIYIPTVHREGSTFKLKDGIPMFFGLIKLWWFRL